MPDSSRRAAPGGLTRSALIRQLALAGAVASLLLAIPASTSAAGSVTLSTPYPAVAVPPGEKVSFKLSVRTDVSDRVDLTVADVPDGWIASLRGEGFVVDGVQTSGDDPVELTLDVTVPEDAAAGTGRVTVRAESGPASDSLNLDIRVEETAAGQITLESDFPVLQGSADDDFKYTMRLRNDTAEDQVFTLQATGPAGWQVEARPSGQSQAASATVTAGSSTTISVTATPPDNVAAADYPIAVTASAADRTVDAELTAQVIGTFALDISTPNEVLSTRGSAGTTIDQTVTITNTGTGDLAGVTLEADAPNAWTVTFDPATVDVAAGASADAVAHIVPSGDAIAGDYVVTISASHEQADGEIDLRVSVETSVLWGIVGIALIVLVVVGLGWVFQRYGRR